MVPEERLAYEMIDGMRVEGYSSQISLTPADGGGTVVRWHSRWEQANPVHALVLRLAIRDACKRLAKAAALGSV